MRMPRMTTVQKVRLFRLISLAPAAPSLELEAGSELSGASGGARSEFVNSAGSARVVRSRYRRLRRASEVRIQRLLHGRTRRVARGTYEAKNVGIGVQVAGIREVE